MLAEVVQRGLVRSYGRWRMDCLLEVVKCLSNFGFGGHLSFAATCGQLSLRQSMGQYLDL